MKSIIVSKVFNPMVVLNALKSAGMVITITSQPMGIGSQLSMGGTVVLPDASDVAAAQAILDSFDPIQAQAEIEAEEKAAKEKAAALETLADWMQKHPAEAVKLMEITAKVAVIETKVAALESTAAVKP